MMASYYRRRINARQPRRTPHHVIQASTSEGLVIGPYVAARVGFNDKVHLVIRLVNEFNLSLEDI